MGVWLEIRPCEPERYEARKLLELLTCQRPGDATTAKLRKSSVSIRWLDAAALSADAGYTRPGWDCCPMEDTSWVGSSR